MATANDLGYIPAANASAAAIPAATSAGLQALINALSATAGGSIILQPTVYTLTAPLVINKPNVALVGADQRATSFVFAYQGIAVDFGPLAVTCQMKDITVTGPAASAGVASNAIRLQAGSSVHIYDCTIFNCAVGIQNYGTSPATAVEQCRYDKLGSSDCGSFVVSERDGVAAGAAIKLINCAVANCQADAVIIKQSSPATMIAACLFSESKAATSIINCGAAVGTLENVMITDCSFASTAAVTQSVLLAPSGAQAPGSVSVYNSDFKAVATYGVFCNTALAGLRVQVTGCTYRNITNTFANIDQTTGTIVSNNTSSSGATLFRAPTVTNAVISGNSVTGAALFDLIVLGAATGCTISNNYLASATTGRVIAVTGLADRLAVTGNNITTAGGNAFVLTTNNSVTISGNSITVNGAGDGLLIPGSATIPAIISGNTVITTGSGPALRVTTASALIGLTGNYLATGSGANSLILGTALVLAVSNHYRLVASGGTLTTTGNSQLL
jgi:hypothetical protein